MTIQEKAKAAIPLLQAVVEGKTIQCKMADGSWVDDNVLISDPANWRIKPEPREWWVYWSPLRDDWITCSSSAPGAIHVREVL